MHRPNPRPNPLSLWRSHAQSHPRSPTWLLGGYNTLNSRWAAMQQQFRVGVRRRVRAPGALRANSKHPFVFDGLVKQ